VNLLQLENDRVICRHAPNAKRQDQGRKQISNSSGKNS
jgi:hypothetical protein